eukprot:CAMPEP_0177434684 /NCGR_PEP_ID=MMETSP0369-20130122/615_1 /TAXON_ID=447022 ORGANISM="Scrippsiella hangoei-like, Strain SHHI-4" /NCGR_SAMPLE_ID=MMETSP0369 /ASSEMBLY_ACC=CAM_ASM_000364 /LENGTH=63 /DNA_ID=CAMNT_0018905725 /DNA_START=22 /DNA_END=209 /DNA_ORIENTATION=-
MAFEESSLPAPNPMKRHAGWCGERRLSWHNANLCLTAALRCSKVQVLWHAHPMVLLAVYDIGV